MVERFAQEPRTIRRRRSKRNRGQGFTKRAKSRRPGQSFPYRTRQTLLSQGEAAFFGSLCEAVAGRFHIMCKVRLADVITCTSKNWKRGFGAAISQKHLDFVLCEKETMRFVLAIELDDRSHERPERRRRDSFVNSALYTSCVAFLRFEAHASYSVSLIRARIEGLLRARNYTLPTCFKAISNDSPLGEPTGK